MPVKIILDDEREFEVGQEVEWMDVYGDKKEWVKCEVCNERLALIARAPDRYRAIAPKVKRPMTAWEASKKIREGALVRYNGNIYHNCAIHELGDSVYVAMCSRVVQLKDVTVQFSPTSPWQKFEVEE